MTIAAVEYAKEFINHIPNTANQADIKAYTLYVMNRLDIPFLENGKVLKTFEKWVDAGKCG